MLSNFRKAGGALALSAILGTAALTAPTAQAVNLAEDGVGEVLLFPFYTVRGPVGEDGLLTPGLTWETQLYTANVSDRVVVYKIRFREAFNTREVLDFLVFLSPFDVWTARLSYDPNNNVAFVTTQDSSCTFPEIPSALPAPGTPLNAASDPFLRNTLYIGDFDDSAPTDISRTFTGYVEVIQMASIIVGDPRNSVPAADGVSAANIVNWVTHTGENVVSVRQGTPGTAPANCAALRSSLSGSPSFTPEQLADLRSSQLLEPINALQGSAVLVNPGLGQAFAYEPTVLANFYNDDVIIGEDVISFRADADPSADVGSNIFAGTGTTEPDLNSGAPSIARLLDSSGSNVVTNPTNSAGDFVEVDFLQSVDAVSAVMMRDTVNNRWTAGSDPVSGALAQTDWIVTFPTKSFYVDRPFDKLPGLPPSPNPNAFPPFNTIFNFDENASGDGESAVPVLMAFLDEEEFTCFGEFPGGFSPLPPPGVVPCLPFIRYEANIVSFKGTSNIFFEPSLGAGVRRVIDQESNFDAELAPIYSGFAKMAFASGRPLDSGVLATSTTIDGVPFTGAQFFGLPTIGFAVLALPDENGFVNITSLNHTYDRRIITDAFFPSLLPNFFQ